MTWAPRGKAKRKQKARTGGTDVIDRPLPSSPANIDCWTWPNDASLPASDSTHRQFGWWAFDTVNANVWDLPLTMPSIRPQLM